MGKELRLSMAMGGGVSLGTFSGASLTQAVKLMVMDGYYHQKYDRITIDSFSGASAGAISLAIMLRVLIQQSDEQLDRAEINLKNELGEEQYEMVKEKLNVDEPLLSSNPNKTFNKWHELLAIQAAQDLQKQIWVNDLNINSLLGISKNREPSRSEWRNIQKKLDRQPSLFLRENVEKIAHEYFPINQETFDVERRALIDNRCLFGCTLTNLSPITMSSKDAFEVDDSGMFGLRDGLRSFYHRDMRVFDLHFTDILPLLNGANDNSENAVSFPERWYRIHSGPPVKDHLDNISADSTWSVIAATAIACGAFPGAFEPVFLKRRKSEYGETIWKQMKIEKFAELTEDERYKFENYPSDHYPFAYADGGAFNNEPIREAYRLAYFMDSSTSGQTDNVRRVLTVDPNVTDEYLSLGNNFTQRFDVQYRKEGGRRGNVERTYKYKHKNSFSMLLAYGGDLAGAILNQASVNEADKIWQKKDELKQKRQFKKQFRKLQVDTPDLEEIKEMITLIKDKLDAMRLKDQLPTVQVNFEREIRRIIHENPQETNSLEEDEIQRFLKFGKNLNNPDGLDLNVWYKVLMLAQLDVMTGLTGVDSNAHILSIAPFVIKEGLAEKLQLFGTSMRGFGGFFSQKARLHDFEAGKWAAMHFLELDNFGDKSNHNEQSEGRNELFTNLKSGDFQSDISMSDVNNEIKTNSGFFKERILELLPFMGRKRFRLFFKKDYDNTIDDLLHLSDRKPVTIKLKITGVKEKFKIIKNNNGLGLYEMWSRQRSIMPIRANSHSAVLELTYDLSSQKWTGDLLHANEILKIEVLNYSFRAHRNPTLMIPMPKEKELMEAFLATNDPILTLDLSNIDLKGDQYREFEGTPAGYRWHAGYHVTSLEEILFSK